jgi:beta-phosphoglucomutase
LYEDGFLLAVGSSGPPENVELVLQQLGCREWFAAATTGADVARGKPDPQVFQIAAQRLGIPPSCCAVIEDAAAGIAAANAAGAVSVALVSTGHSRAEYAAADHVVDRLEELSPEVLRGWIALRG